MSALNVVLLSTEERAFALINISPDGYGVLKSERLPL
jgi:hypothetical protein